MEFESSLVETDGVLVKVSLSASEGYGMTVVSTGEVVSGSCAASALDRFVFFLAFFALAGFSSEIFWL